MSQFSFRLFFAFMASLPFVLAALETAMDEDSLRQAQEFLRNKLEYENQAKQTQSDQQDVVRQEQKIYNQKLQDQRLENQHIESAIQDRRLDDKRVQQRIDDDRRRR